MATLSSQLPEVVGINKIDTLSRCRSCFEATGSINIFDTRTNNAFLWEIIKYCTNEQIHRNNDLPSKICILCFDKFQTTYNFLREFRQTQKKLLNSINTPINNSDNEIDIDDKFKRFLHDFENRTEINNEDELKCFPNEIENETPVNSFKKKFKKINSVFKDLCDTLVENKKQLLRPDIKFPPIYTKKVVETLERQANEDIDDFMVEDETCNPTDEENLINTGVIDEILDKHVESYTNKQVNGTSNYEVYTLSPGLTEESRKKFLNDLTPADPRKEANTQCFECLTVFQSGADLKRHAKATGHDIPPRYKCSICGNHFKFRHMYRNHLRSHKIATEDSICEICGACVRTTSLPRHMEMHGSGFTCEECGKTFTQRAYLRDHVKRHQALSENTKKELCHICGVRRNNLSGLNEHMNKKHGNSSNWTHQCNLCSKSFSSKSSLSLHVHRKHVRKTTTPKTVTPKIKRNRTNRIIDGEAVEVKEASTTQNQKNDPKRLVKCTICSKQMTYATHYHHMRIHKGLKPYQCKVCSKTFRQCHHLKSHMNIHLNLKPYECRYCKKSFRHQTTLIIHERSHTGETPYFCSFCQKGFAHSSTMKKHEESHVKRELIMRNRLSKHIVMNQI